MPCLARPTNRLALARRDAGPCNAHVAMGGGGRDGLTHARKADGALRRRELLPRRLLQADLVDHSRELVPVGRTTAEKAARVHQ